MDNQTLFETLSIITCINAVFTILITTNLRRDLALPWRISALAIVGGLLLLLLKDVVGVFFAVVVANYFILIGNFFQVITAVNFETRVNSFCWRWFLLISVIYLAGFLGFTYLTDRPDARIFWLSAMIFVIHVWAVGFAVVKLDNLMARFSREIWLLFAASALFDLARMMLSMTEYGSLSLNENGKMATAVLAFLMLKNIFYFVGMFHASIREHNDMVNQEKYTLNFLFGFLNDTAKYLELDKLYVSIERILKQFGVHSGAIYLRDEASPVYVHSMAYLFDEMDLSVEKVKKFGIGEGVSGRAVAEDRVIIMPIENYPDPVLAEEYQHKGVTYLIAIPLKRTNEIFGAIALIYTREQTKAHEVFDEVLLGFLGEQISLVLHNALLYEKLSLLAHTDYLTGLFNRRKLTEMFSLEVKRVRRYHKPLSTALFDLDLFKSINDTYGHECGDEVIKKFSEILRNSCRDTDYLCRWGGEEFLIIFAETNLEDARIAAERIRHIVETSAFTCLGLTHVTVSAGVTELRNTEESMEQIVNRADEALYQAKQNGRNQVRYIQ